MDIKINCETVGVGTGRGSSYGKLVVELESVDELSLIEAMGGAKEVLELIGREECIKHFGFKEEEE